MKRRTLADSIAEQNALALGKERRMPSGIEVKVLAAGLYNGPGHKNPVQAQPGDVIMVPRDWYVDELVEAGLVSRIDGLADDTDEPRPSLSQSGEGVELEEMTVAELRMLAQDAEIAGYAGMRKAELIEALAAAD